MVHMKGWTFVVWLLLLLGIDAGFCAINATDTNTTVVALPPAPSRNASEQSTTIAHLTVANVTQEENATSQTNPPDLSKVPYLFPKSAPEVNETIRNILLHINISTTSPPQISKHNPKEDSEWIQLDGENSEDELHPMVLRNDVRSPQRDHGPGVPLVRGQLAAILAGIFVVLAVGGYIALLSWRRYLENRYGNREMLVNEEEQSEGTDMKYFSVSKL